MPRLDEITLAIYGDTDAGYGKTYLEIAEEAPQAERLRRDRTEYYRYFEYGKKPKQD